MDKREASIVRMALDALGLALAEHGHKWTDLERALYDEATKLLLTSGAYAD